MAGSGSNPSRLTISLEVDNKSALPKLLEGRTVAILGRPLENHTAESREPSRRHQLHDQILRARRLRTSLEEAADLADALPNDSPSSYSRAMSILQSSFPDMNQLVRLTEAIRGKHTIDDPDLEYDEWNAWTARKNDLGEAQRKREQRILRRQLREFAKEKHPELKLNEELEKRHDELTTKPKEEEFFEDSGEEADGDFKMGVNMTRGDVFDDGLGNILDVSGSEVEYESHTGFAPLKSSVDTDSENEYNVKCHANEAEGRKKPQASQADEDDLPLISHATTSSRLTSDRSESEISYALKSKPPGKRARVSVKTENNNSISARFQSPAKQPTRKNPPEMKKYAPEQRKSPPETIATKSPSSATAKGKQNTGQTALLEVPSKARIASPDVKRRQARPTKRCHHCKAQTTRYRNCNYWKLTGKCRKVYCINCLSSKYTLGDDVCSSSTTGKSPLKGSITIEDVLACPAYDAEWHCPSCLGTCQCQSCVRERKKEEEREKSRNDAAGRKPRSRRSAANASNSYSYFF